MDILALHGGNHLQGNTATLLEAFLDGARAVGHAAQRLDIIKMDVNPCWGCNYCRPQGHGTGKCAQRDQMPYADTEKADILVLTSPVFWWGFSAQLKAYIDRLYALPFKIWRTKKVKIIFSSELPVPSIAARTQAEIWGYMSTYLKFEFLGVLEGSSGKIPIARQTELLELARKQGMAL